MVEQLDLFEQLEELSITSRSEKQAKRKSNLVERQHALVDWLKEHFIPNHFYSIEDIVSNFVDKEGNPYYTLNTNPYNHDKCVALSSDVRTINWTITDRYHIIIKDKQGGCKLCESKAEFDTWKQEQLKPLETKWKYLNNLEWKADRDDTIPMINLNDRALDINEMKPVEVFKKELNEREEK